MEVAFCKTNTRNLMYLNYQLSKDHHNKHKSFPPPQGKTKYPRLQITKHHQTKIPLRSGMISSKSKVEIGESGERNKTINDQSWPTEK